MLQRRWGLDTGAGTHEGNAYSQSHQQLVPGRFHHLISLLTHFHLPQHSLIHGCLVQVSLNLRIVIAVIMQVKRRWLPHHSHSLLKLLNVGERAVPALCAPQSLLPSSLPLPAWQVLYCLSFYL